jgi:hypothetical protein
MRHCGSGLSLFNRCERTRKRIVCVKIVFPVPRRASANQTLTIHCSSAVAPDQPAGKPIAIPAVSRLTAPRRVLSLAIAQQPRIDNSPLVASPRLKIQQRRARIL